MEGEEEPFLRNIEWHMMDKEKFFPLSMLSHFCVRGSLYPLTLIKTRLQLQKHDQMYKGKCVNRILANRKQKLLIIVRINVIMSGSVCIM